MMSGLEAAFFLQSREKGQEIHRDFHSKVVNYTTNITNCLLHVCYYVRKINSNPSSCGKSGALFHILVAIQNLLFACLTQPLPIAELLTLMLSFLLSLSPCLQGCLMFGAEPAYPF